MSDYNWLNLWIVTLHKVNESCKGHVTLVSVASQLFISASYLQGDSPLLEFLTLPELADLMCDLPVDAAVAGAAVLCTHAGPAYAAPFPLLPHRILGHGEESCMLVFALDVVAQRRHHAHLPGSEEHFGVLFIHGEVIYFRCRRGSEPIPSLVHAGKSSVLQPRTCGRWCIRIF